MNATIIAMLGWPEIIGILVVVHILVGGRIVTSGGFDLAKRVEHEGYDPILKELGIASAETPVAEGAAR